ncbi:hypothetical protein QJQ45_016339 [Haematococcus lacustris]|nr:hypothetical protein QJQ45_016339 [Haematococcus lacustris]
MDRIDALCTLHTPIRHSRGMTADCNGFALVSCVYEEGVGWVVKRSKTGAGFATLFRSWRLLQYMLLHVAAHLTGNHVRRLYFIGYHSGILYAVDTISNASKLLANNVKADGGLALFPAANKLLFISSRNSLCELDLQSGECQVITPSVWPEGGRLLTGNDQLALYIVPIAGGSNFFSCSMQGKVCNLRNVRHSAISADYRLNSRGDLLIIDQPDKELPRICCLPALLPPPEASACKTLSPKGCQ